MPKQPRNVQVVVRIHPPSPPPPLHSSSRPAVVAVPSAVAASTPCTRTALLVVAKAATVVVDATPSTTTSRRPNRVVDSSSQSIGTTESLDGNSSVASSCRTGHSGASWWPRKQRRGAKPRTHPNVAAAAAAAAAATTTTVTAAADSAAVPPASISSSTSTAKSRSFSWRLKRGDKSGVQPSPLTTESTVPTTTVSNNNRSVVQDWDAVYGPIVSSRQFYHQVVDSVCRTTTTTTTATPLPLRMNAAKDAAIPNPPSHSALATLLSQGQSVTCLLYGAAAATAACLEATPSRQRIVESNATMDPAASEGFLWHVVQDLCALALSNRVDATARSTVQLSVVQVLPTRTIRDLLAHPAAENHDESLWSWREGHSSLPDEAAAENRDPNTSQSTTIAPQRKHVAVQTTIQSLLEARHLLQQVESRRSRHFSHSDESLDSSHIIYTFTVTTTCGSSSSSSTDTLTAPTTTSATLTLVHLAGRPSRSTGLKGSVVSVPHQHNDGHPDSHEMTALGRVLTSLSHGASSLPSYDDCVLTKLLKNALSVHCRIVFVACVSSASECVNETMATLQFAQQLRSTPAKSAAVSATPTKKIASFDAHGMLTTPSQRVAALQAENLILQARIANFSRRHEDSEPSNELVVADHGSDPLKRVPPKKGGLLELASLEAKLLRARQQRQTTREKCQSVAAAAERLRLRCQVAKETTKSTTRSNIDANKAVSAQRQREKDLASQICDIIYEKVELCNKLIAMVKTEESLQPMSGVEQRLPSLAKALGENEAKLQDAIASADRQPANQKSSRQQVLNDDQCHRHELQARIETLGHSMDVVTHENETLRTQNKQLVAEVQRLRMIAKPQGSAGQNLIGNVDFLSDDLDSLSEGPGGMVPFSNDSQRIRSHAALLLDWADRAIQKARSSTPFKDTGGGGGSTVASSMATDFRPSFGIHGRSAVDPLANGSQSDGQVWFGNLDALPNAAAFSPCPCQDSILSSNPAHVDFYLPKLGVMCCCGRQQDESQSHPDPNHLANILRDWQVDFLQSLGLIGAADLVHAYNSHKHSPHDLAKAMRFWRAQQGLLAVKTRSCGIALRIWSRTCQAVVQRALLPEHCSTPHHREAAGTMGQPYDVLNVSYSSASAVSSLGFGNSVSDLNLSAADDLLY
jgi:Kinesin motor domain